MWKYIGKNMSSGGWGTLGIHDLRISKSRLQRCETVYKVVLTCLKLQS